MAFAAKDMLKKKIGLLLLSSLGTLFFCNAALEIASEIQNRDYRISWMEGLELETRHTGVPLDRRTKLQVVKDMRAAGQWVYPAAYPHHFLAHLTNDQKTNGRSLVPLGFISKATYVQCNELGQWSVFTTDRYGFQNEDWVVGPKKNPNDKTAILMGDSIAEGQCVQKGQDIASRLRERGLRAISLGSAGGGPLRELAIMKEYALPLKPTIIFWLFTPWNDLDDAVVENEDPFLTKYLQDGFTQNLIHRQKEINQVWKNFLEKRIDEEEDRHQQANTGVRSITSLLKPYVTIYQIRKRLALTAGHARNQRGANLLGDALRQAKKLCDDNGIQLIFIYLPQRPGSWMSGKTVRTQIKSLTATLKIPTIDLPEIFSSRNDYLEFFPKPKIFFHLRPAAHDATAETLAPYVK
ncbi:MAG: hypothetical protein HY401_06875 [Elusimicrobia bacterium]|nr:hypothetical protein [Elusimicrobiota bacterium]